jgi:hypothetical protein
MFFEAVGWSGHNLWRWDFADDDPSLMVAKSQTRNQPTKDQKTGRG